MSETPRVDAFAWERLQGPAQTQRYKNHTEWAEFARQLERELDAMRRAFTAEEGESYRLATALTQAQARCADVEKDAARYRWLRECSIVRSDRTMYVTHNRYDNGKFLRTECPSGTQLDAAIDAALKEPR